ncbi:MAG: hypothetical protein ACOYXM_11290 [Actinomycetota bacterium]
MPARIRVVLKASGDANGQRDSGQALPLVLGVLAVAVVVLLALVPLARGAAESARARTAADAAALAGAAEGEEAARDIAEANGGELVMWRASGADVWVAVTVGDARAVAKATRD